MNNISYLKSRFNEKLQNVLSYENKDIVEKFSQERNINSNESEIYFNEVKKFLLLCSISENTYTPSKEIDKIWHTFILFTRDYRFFCKNYLGTFIDHIPELKNEKGPYTEILNKYQHTIKTIYNVYDDVNKELWPILTSSECFMTGNCFDCVPDETCSDCQNENEKSIVVKSPE